MLADIVKAPLPDKAQIMLRVAERSSVYSPPPSAFSSWPKLFQLKGPPHQCLGVSPSTGFLLSVSLAPVASECCTWSLRAVSCWQHFCVHTPHGPKAEIPASGLCEISQTPTP